MHRLTIYISVIRYLRTTNLRLSHWNGITYLSTRATFITMVTQTWRSCIFHVCYWKSIVCKQTKMKGICFSICEQQYLYICWKFQFILKFCLGVRDIWSNQVPHEKCHYSTMWKEKQVTIIRILSEKTMQHSIFDRKWHAHIFLKLWIDVRIILRILWMTEDV